MNKNEKIKYDPDLAFFLHKNGAIDYFFKISKIDPSFDNFDRISDNELEKLGLDEKKVRELKEKYREYDVDILARHYIKRILSFLGLGVVFVICFLYCNVSLYDNLNFYKKIENSGLNFFDWSDCTKNLSFLLYYVLIFIKSLFCLFASASIVMIAFSIADGTFNKFDLFLFRLLDVSETIIAIIWIFSPLYFAYIVYASNSRCEFSFFSFQNFECIINYNGIGFVLNFVISVVIWSWLIVIPIIKGFHHYLFPKEDKIDDLAKDNLNILIKLQEYINKNSTKFSVSAIILSILTFLASLFGAFADGYSTIENIGYASTGKTLVVSKISNQRDSILITITNQTDYPITINTATINLKNIKIRYPIPISESDGWLRSPKSIQYSNSITELDVSVQPKTSQTICVDSEINEHYEDNALKFVEFDIRIAYDLANTLNIDGISQIIMSEQVPQTYEDCNLYFFIKQLNPKVTGKELRNFMSHNSSSCNCK